MAPLWQLWARRHLMMSLPRQALFLQSHQVGVTCSAVLPGLDYVLKDLLEKHTLGGH
jgi:hypothetical protein